MTLTGDLLQRQTVMLLESYCDHVELVDEVTTDSCEDCSEKAPVWIHHSSFTGPLCELSAAGFLFLFGHEVALVEVRRLP